MKSRDRLGIQALDILQRTDEALDVLYAVADRDIGEDIADIAELDLYVVLISEKVIYLYSGKSHIARIDRQLGDIVIEDTAAVYYILTVGVIAAYGIYLASCVLCHRGDLLEGLPPPQSEIPARNIEA